ncbi:Thiosulfate sulfurtransferase PspE, partial [Dysosmobacter welbionis]
WRTSMTSWTRAVACWRTRWGPDGTTAVWPPWCWSCTTRSRATRTRPGGWRRTGPFGAAGRAALMTPPTPLSCWPPSAGRGPTGGPCSGPPPPGPRGTRRCTGGTGRSF